MADWYVSGAAYAAIPQFAISTAYTVGQIIRPLATPAFGREYPQRCTTAGTTAATEPSWNNVNNTTTTSGTATFTNVAGQSAYGWGAAAGTLYSLTQSAGSARPLVGDRVFIARDHTETGNSTNYSFTTGVMAYGVIQIISVNRAGSVPPVAADVQSGAAIITTTAGVFALDPYCNMYWQGISFTYGGAPGANGAISFSVSGRRGHYFKNCAFVFAQTSGTGQFLGQPGSLNKIVFDNTTVQFNQAAGFIGSSNTPVDFTWINTPSALVGGTVPTTLFQASGNGTTLFTCRGVDLSAVTGALSTSVNSGLSVKLLLDSCRIAPGVTRTLPTSSITGTADEFELVNCYDGTNSLSERHTQAGDLTTNRTTYMTGGAQDEFGNFSHQMVSNTRTDQWSMTLDGFLLDIGNTAVGASHTATIELVSSSSLNNNDIQLKLEYPGTSGSPVATLIDSIASPLVATTPLPTSTASWVNPPSTPVYQRLQVTFTPQQAGRLRGLVRFGKPSATVWLNPQITVT